MRLYLGELNFWVYDKAEIIENLNSKEVIDFVNKYNIITMIIFGSITNNEFNQESDVDLALLSNKEIQSLNIKLNTFAEQVDSLYEESMKIENEGIFQ